MSTNKRIVLNFGNIEAQEGWFNLFGAALIVRVKEPVNDDNIEDALEDVEDIFADCMAMFLRNLKSAGEQLGLEFKLTTDPGDGEVEGL